MPSGGQFVDQLVQKSMLWQTEIKDSRECDILVFVVIMLEEEKLRPQVMSPYREPLVSVLAKFPDTAATTILNRAADAKGPVYMV